MMRYICVVLAVVTMGAFPEPYQQQHHTTLVVNDLDTLSDWGFSTYAYGERYVPELSVSTYNRRLSPVWLLTRSYSRQWVSVSVGEHILSIVVTADRKGRTPSTASAVCEVESSQYQHGPLAPVSSEPFGLVRERPVVYGRKIAVTGPGWFVVTVSTENVMPRDLWPDGVRYPFAVQLYMTARISE